MSLAIPNGLISHEKEMAGAINMLVVNGIWSTIKNLIIISWVILIEKC